MSKFAVGQMVDNAADDHESGMVVAVVSNSRRQLPDYAVDTALGYGVLQFYAEEKLVLHTAGHDRAR